MDAKLEHLLNTYLLAAGTHIEPHTPLFRSTLSGNGKISNRRVHRYHVAKLARQIRNLRSVRLGSDDGEHLLEKIKPICKETLRDRAIIGRMLYVSATPREIAAFRRSHYLDNDAWCCIKLSRSRSVEVPNPLHILCVITFAPRTHQRTLCSFGSIAAAE